MESYSHCKSEKAIVLKFHFRCDPESIDYLVALLAEMPFSAFEELEEGVNTAMGMSLWTPECQKYLDSLKELVPFVYAVEQEESKNWNALWEADFKEIVIDNFCMIRAPFHQSAAQFQFEIVIEPRMAFGTGHHETTRLMMRSMQIWSQSENPHIKVLDFGSGSGVLAILAAKMGASQITAIESDEHAIVNLKENIIYNDHPGIVALWKDHLHDIEDASVDLVLANITRNVLQEHAVDLGRILAKKGCLIVSGFLRKDHEIIIRTFSHQGLVSVAFLEENDWIAHTFEQI